MRARPFIAAPSAPPPVPTSSGPGELLATGKVVEAEQAMQTALKSLDKAAEKGVIHKNNAARRKSRLMRALNNAKTA
jgi:hypothetical protein